jgi:hypothetical protein
LELGELSHHKHHDLDLLIVGEVVSKLTWNKETLNNIHSTKHTTCSYIHVYQKRILKKPRKKAWWNKMRTPNFSWQAAKRNTKDCWEWRTTTEALLCFTWSEQRTVKASNRKICLLTDAVSKKSQQQQQKMTLLSILELLKENWAH